MKKILFICSNCGYRSAKWLGKCPECGTWNSFVEEELKDPAKHPRGASSSGSKRAEITGISAIDGEEKDRYNAGISEFDRVTGGLIPGQTILLSGEPGIGKSTMILEVAGNLARHGRVLYVNGEESNSQVKQRAVRTGIGPGDIFLYPENDIDNVTDAIKKENPRFVFIDSIQTVYSPSFESLPGSIVQMRETASVLVKLCKEMDIVLFIVGHVTKSGVIAGPKVLEHIVDTVLFLEMDGRGYYRILRSNKNRFFSTDEIGFFTMEENGLKSIGNVTEAFLYEHEEPVSGISFFPMAEGNRVIPVEIQALTAPSEFNYPKRTSDGLDIGRLFMLIAVMEKILKINLSQYDIYLNVTNGLHIQDPGLDLPAAAAIYSSYKGLSSPLDLMVCGEVGLTGEVRAVKKLEKRIMESARSGFKKIMVPNQAGKFKESEGFKLFPVKNIKECISLMF